MIAARWMIASGATSATRRSAWFAIRQVGPSGLGAAGQLRGGFAVGGGVEVGGDHMAA